MFIMGRDTQKRSELKNLCGANVSPASVAIPQSGFTCTLDSESPLDLIPFYLHGLPLCKNPFPDLVIAQRRHCETHDKLITSKQIKVIENQKLCSTTHAL
jgi:hypothetical protein